MARTRARAGQRWRRMMAGLRRLFRDDSPDPWPSPSYYLNEEPHFLFILTPPYCGSTALAQILNSGQGTAFLHHKAEGQWLVPGMCTSDRWDPEKRIDWSSVRAVWMSRIELIRSLTGRVELVIEKSPTHLVRLDQLLDTFPRHTVLAFNRNPFARGSSALYRNHHAARLTEPERLRALAQISRRWLLRSGWIRKWIEEKNIPYVSYESFCADPAACIAPLTRLLPVLKTVNPSREIRVKDYAPQKLADQNASQIAKLRRNEILAISAVLESEPELVSFFGYDPSGREELQQVPAS